MDAEWQPTMGLGPTRLSVFQLAARDRVYILDMLALSETLTEKDWDLLYTEVLAASYIKKLGYGIADDIKLVMETAQSPHAMFDNVVDLSKFAQKLQKDYPTLLKPVNAESMPSKGLSELTRLVLGRPLNKDEQCSDWENRPLREAQLKYAALDAFCLLQIYDELHSAARKKKLDLEDLFEGVQPGAESGQAKRCAVNEDRARPQHPVPGAEFRVVVDTMVQGLGRYLRLCGIDTIVLGNGEHHDQAVKIAQKEGRVVITSGAPYERLKQYLAPGRCFNMDTSLPAQEQLRKYCSSTKLWFVKRNLLTRCVACNVSRYALVAHADMRQLCEFQAIADRQVLGSSTVETLTRNYWAGCSLNLRSGLFSNGTRVQCGGLSFERLGGVETFYVCTSCGKVYWEGSHHIKLKEQMRLANVLSCDAPVVDVPGSSAD
ncbi:hypothetical protein HPB48_012398 [Haemaphysalis longicornis]|uniref:Uncharacterized protein n=1 Tax=Haemaphysalis longicornis TaxID=44386 RepID=A0A9J6G1L2_HAELO|nr:hypothetical protein HPB48_012398 [Haemaphysalis longicornis]